MIYNLWYVSVFSIKLNLFHNFFMMRILSSNYTLIKWKCNISIYSLWLPNLFKTTIFMEYIMGSPTCLVACSIHPINSSEWWQCTELFAYYPLISNKLIIFYLFLRILVKIFIIYYYYYTTSYISVKKVLFAYYLFK